MTRKPEHLKDPSLPSPPFRSYQLFTAITTDSPCTSHQSLTWPNLSLPSPYATIPESNSSQGRRDQSMADGGNTAPSNGGEFLLQLLRRPPQTKPSPAPAAAASSVASPLPINAPGAERRTYPRQQQYEDPAVAAVGPSHSFSPPGFGGALPAQIPPWLLPPVLPQPSPPRMSPPQIGISLPGSSAPPGFSPPGSEYHKARPFTGASRPPFLQGEGQKLGFMPPNLDSVDHRRSNEQNRSFDNGGLHRVQQQQFRHQRQQRPQFHRDGAPAASERNNNIPEGGHSQSRRDHSGWSQPDNQRSLRASEQGTRWANGQHPEARSFFDSRRKAQSAGSSGPYDQDYTRINAIKGAPATPGNELGHDLPNQRSAKSRAPGPSHKPGGSGHPNTMNGGRQDEIHGIERKQDAQKKDSSRSASHFVKREALERESQIGAQFEYSDTSLALNEESSAIQTVEELYVGARFEFSDTSLTPNEESRAIRIVEESRCKNEDGDNEIFGEEDVDNANHLGVESFSYKKTLPDPDILVEQTNETLILKEETDEKSETKNSSHSRKKEFRTDFSRGHNVSSQRVRIQRRSMRCRYDIQRLTPFFLSLYTSLVPAEEEKSKQKQLLLLLEKLVNKEWPDAQLHLYGSCANSFGVSNSDIDLCLAIDATGTSKTDILLKLADILQSDNLQNVQALTHARVPIVKLMDPASGISCDICINNLLAVVNTKLLRDYAQIDERLRQLAFIVKHWAKSRSVNETYKGTLSSYAYVLMCIHFLQMRRPAILPCLQEMKATYAVIVGGIGCSFFDQVEKLRGFGNQNKETIAELVWAFFNYWAYAHDYANGVISVRTARIISKQEKDWTRRIGNDRHLICIEDPFETSHDLGRVVDKFTIKILREEFERAADILQFDPNPGVTLFEPYTRESSQD